MASLDLRYLGEWLLPLFHVHFEQVVKGHLTGFSIVKILDFLLGMKGCFVGVSPEMIACLSFTRLSLTCYHSLITASINDADSAF